MKKGETLGALGLILFVAVMMMGCGSSSSGGGFSNVDVQFQVSGNTITHNANTSVDSRDPLSGTDFRTLTWFCGNYQGNQRSRVELRFKKSNNTWVLDNTAVSGGNCS